MCCHPKVPLHGWPLDSPMGTLWPADEGMYSPPLYERTPWGHFFIHVCPRHRYFLPSCSLCAKCFLLLENIKGTVQRAFLTPVFFH
jgi:hypothetical protein